MNTETQKLLDEIILRLEPLSPGRVVLFGSPAQGLATGDSALDLLVKLWSHR